MRPRSVSGRSERAHHRCAGRTSEHSGTAGAREERSAAVAGGLGAPFLSDAERAALRPAVLSALILTITLTGMFHRVTTAIREPAGTTWD
ncbi:hypothetical protein [Streptomyces sp. NPDC001135]